jgi:hypothetical protein
MKDMKGMRDMRDRGGKTRKQFMPFMLFFMSFTLLLLASASAQQSPANRYWAQWRGPHMTGVSRTATPPTEWSETKNVRWKIQIPGRGSASPVVWGDRVYLLTAVPVGVTHSTRPGARRRSSPISTS